MKIMVIVNLYCYCDNPKSSLYYYMSNLVHPLRDRHQQAAHLLAHSVVGTEAAAV